MLKSQQKLAKIIQEHHRLGQMILEYANEMNSENLWLSINEAIEESGLSASQIRYAAKTGKLRSRKESEKKIFYASEDLERLAGSSDERTAFAK